MLSFLGKIIAASAAIALLIKYSGPYLPLSATPATALTIVLLPSLVMAMLMTWRSQGRSG